MKTYLFNKIVIKKIYKILKNKQNNYKKILIKQN